MEKKNCLIAGLPESGKSTYLGALWYITQNGNGKIDLALGTTNMDLPENTSLLDSLSQKWQRVEDMDRTSNDASEDISFLMCPKGSERLFSLEVPDFRGESIRQILTMNQPSKFNEWCSKAGYLLFFISNYQPGSFADDFNDDDEEENLNENSIDSPVIPTLEAKDMTPAAQNMLILRYLKENYRFDKIVVCLTAWDKILSDDNTAIPEKYLMEKSPALYNFISYHFGKIKYFGLSAQGEEYKYDNVVEENGKTVKKVTEECKMRKKKKTRDFERAFVCEGNKKSFDITLPIAELFK